MEAVGWGSTTPGPLFGAPFIASPQIRTTERAQGSGGGTSPDGTYCCRAAWRILLQPASVGSVRISVLRSLAGYRSVPLAPVRRGHEETQGAVGRAAGGWTGGFVGAKLGAGAGAAVGGAIGTAVPVVGNAVGAGVGGLFGGIVGGIAGAFGGSAVGDEVAEQYWRLLRLHDPSDR